MPDAIDELLRQSRHIITSWEALGVPGGRAEDNLRVIREHLNKLAEVSKLRPSLAAEIETLAGRYAAIAAKIRLRAN